MLRVIVLKGLFYLHVFSKHQIIGKEGFEKLSNSIDQLLQTLGTATEFALICIAIKSSLYPCKEGLMASKSIVKGKSIDSYGEYFQGNFCFWIKQLGNLSKLDESNFVEGAPGLATLNE